MSVILKAVRGSPPSRGSPSPGHTASPWGQDRRTDTAVPPHFGRAPALGEAGHWHDGVWAGMGLAGPHMLRTPRRQRPWGYIHVQSSAATSSVLPGVHAGHHQWDRCPMPSPHVPGSCPTLSPQVPGSGCEIRGEEGSLAQLLRHNLDLLRRGPGWARRAFCQHAQASLVRSGWQVWPPVFFSFWAINGLQAYRKHLALGHLRANKL